ncbi:hypothetical protein [Methylomicrobium sp. Wu6]|uniref:HlyD family efflux transporter periplasmic adaptor subunit n=1 Tax=Methylomicrobium sp. Wu6 TaxID=3107928 RepID=UPI002DD66393|nr:hypothetical protein [Methylomicrobium sp. Wu6]MEC4749415.1 hypothetical protein [Methylomicrobium sp. Wu6]
MLHVINVQQGQGVPVGTPLLQLVDKNQRVVRLGIEHEDLEHLQLKQMVFAAGQYQVAKLGANSPNGVA